MAPQPVRWARESGGDQLPLGGHGHSLIKEGKIQAGHDIGSGGLITTLLEMCFAENDLGATIDLSGLSADEDLIKTLFAENAGVVIQADSSVEATLEENFLEWANIGEVTTSQELTIHHFGDSCCAGIPAMGQSL